jgi:hypothetical protein
MDSISLHGTLVAAFLTRSAIFLASDGRVIDSDSGKIFDDWTKVHRLTEQVGMLTAGAYVKHLKEDIVCKCNSRGILDVVGVAQIASLVLQEIWRLNAGAIEAQGKLEEVRIFIFLAGFDETGQPRLFYSDNNSQPKFAIQERQLFRSGYDLEIAAISTGSGKWEDPSELLKEEIGARIETGMSVQILPHLLYSAFGATKKKLSVTNPRVGGKTFFSHIDPEGGYLDIWEPHFVQGD